jgi:hypothetical protein
VTVGTVCSAVSLGLRGELGLSFKMLGAGEMCVEDGLLCKRLFTYLISDKVRWIKSGHGEKLTCWTPDPVLIIG